MIAIRTIPEAFTVSGLKNRGIAWEKIMIEPPIKIEAEIIAEKRESR